MSDATDISIEGDEDRWMILERVSESSLPIVVRARANPGLSDFARRNRVTAVICEVERGQVNDHGMPLCIDELYELEDRLIALAKQSGKRVFHTASATGDSRRTMYFAHDSAFDMEEIVISAPCDVAEVWITSDFAFDTYDDFVSPTALDIQLNGDQAVISSLNEHGDDGTKPRKIDFWFYGEPAALAALAAMLSDEGITIDHWLEDERPGLVLTMEAPATLGHFRNISPVIVEAVQATSVEYDGWETLFLGDSPKQSTPEPQTSLLGRLLGKFRR